VFHFLFDDVVDPRFSERVFDDFLQADVVDNRLFLVLNRQLENIVNRAVLGPSLFGALIQVEYLTASESR
jgi:hypothetical protein